MYVITLTIPGEEMTNAYWGVSEIVKFQKILIKTIDIISWETLAIF